MTWPRPDRRCWCSQRPAGYSSRGTGRPSASKETASRVGDAGWRGLLNAVTAAAKTCRQSPAAMTRSTACSAARLVLDGELLSRIARVKARLAAERLLPWRRPALAVRHRRPSSRPCAGRIAQVHRPKDSTPAGSGRIRRSRPLRSSGACRRARPAALAATKRSAVDHGAAAVRVRAA